MTEKRSAKEIAAWKTAHPMFDKRMDEEMLSTAPRWGSLEVSDFLVFARQRDDAIPAFVVKYVEELAEELRWVYDMWTASAATDPHNMLIDMFHNAIGDDRYNFVRQFLQDYAKSHGYTVEPPKDETPPPWRVASEGGGFTSMPPPPQLPREAIDAGNVEPPK